MDWNALPLVIVMYVIGGIGVLVGGMRAEETSLMPSARHEVKWWVACAAVSLLVVVAAAVMHGFIS